LAPRIIGPFGFIVTFGTFAKVKISMAREALADDKAGES
jgi:hypothetical protein